MGFHRFSEYSEADRKFEFARRAGIAATPVTISRRVMTTPRGLDTYLDWLRANTTHGYACFRETRAPYRVRIDFVDATEALMFKMIWPT